MAMDQIDRIRIATPCPTSWDRMAGDERVRHCTLCNLNVYNFSEMKRDEIRDLLMRTEGRLCVRLYRRADGTMITRDCPTGLRALRRRASTVAAAAITALLTLPAFALGGSTCKKPRVDKHGSKVRLTIETVAATQLAKFTGIVTLDGTPLPGAIVTVKNEATGEEVRADTDVNGAFTIADVSDGIYRVDTEMESMKAARVEHVELKASQVAHATITMRLDSSLGEVMVGAVMSPLEEQPHSTSYMQQFLDKLPH